MRGTSRSRRPCARGDVLCRNLGGLIYVRKFVPGRLGKASSHTPSVHVDEKSDEAIVLTKRSNKGRQLPAEVVEGRASPKGKQPTNGRGSDAEPSSHVDPIDGCAPDPRWVQPVCTDGRPKGGARCVSSARRDLCGGRGAILVPTATMGQHVMLQYRSRFWPLSMHSFEPIRCASRS